MRQRDLLYSSPLPGSGNSGDTINVDDEDDGFLTCLRKRLEEGQS